MDQGQGETAWAGVVSTINLPEREWVRRDIEFVANGSEATIGIWVLSGTATRAAIDNLTLRPILAQEVVRYEAEEAILNGVEGTGDSGAYATGFDAREDAITFTVQAEQAGEYTVRVIYANGGDDEARVRLVVNESSEVVVLFPRTGVYSEFSHNQVALPVVLAVGENQITLMRRRDGVSLDVDAIEIQTESF